MLILLCAVHSYIQLLDENPFIWDKHALLPGIMDQDMSDIRLPWLNIALLCLDGIGLN